MAKITLNSALKALAAGKTSDEEKAYLRVETFGLALIRVDADGKPDVGDTQDAIAHYKETRQVPDGGKTLDDLLPQNTKEACPVTGDALFRGCANGVDWSPVSRDLRLVAAYAVETGAVTAMTGSAENAVWALKQTDPPPPWPKLAAAWAKLLKREADGTLTPDEARLVALVKARLVWTKPREPNYVAPAPQPAGAPAAPPAPEPPLGQMIVGNGNITSANSVVTGKADDEPVLIYVMVAYKDAPIFHELKKQFVLPIRAGKVRLVARPADCHGVVKEWIASHKERASIILYLTTSDLLAGDDDVDTTIATYRQARHLPVYVAPCGLEYTALKPLTGLPRSGRPLSKASQQGDTDGWYVEVQQGVMEVVNYLLQQRGRQ